MLDGTGVEITSRGMVGLVDARDEELEVFLTFSAVFGELFG